MITHPITNESGHVIPTHNMDYTFISYVKQKLCENKDDSNENPLRNIYDTILGCPAEQDKEPLNLDLASPEILQLGIEKIHNVISKSEEVMINATKYDNEPRPYSHAMKSFNDVHEVDLKLFDKVIGLLDGTQSHEYGIIDELILKELIKIVEFHGQEIIKYKFSKGIDVDTLRTYLQPCLAQHINTGFIKIHKLLIAEGIISIIDTDQNSKKVNFTNTEFTTHMFCRYRQLQLGIDEYIKNEDEKVIIYVLTFIKHFLNAYANMYEEDGIFKYDSCEEQFQVKTEDWESYHQKMFFDCSSNEGDMLDELANKTISYVSEAHAVTVRATLFVTRGLIEFDQYRQELRDTLTEFVKIDHIEFNSERSRQTKITEYMLNLLEGYKDVTLLEIYSVNNIREKRDFMIKLINNNITKTITLKKVQDEMVKGLRKNKEDLLKCLIGFVQELDIMFDLDQHCRIKEEQSIPSVASAVIASLAFTVCALAYYIFSQKKKDKEKIKE